MGKVARRVARAKNDGPRLFKAYLDYVFHMSAGSRTLAARTLDQVCAASGRSIEPTAGSALPGYVPLAGQLAEALIAQGLDVVVYVGASQFKVDVAIEGEHDGRRYRIAVLCDEGARDDGAYRRTQRASLLRRRGWRVVHVDGVEWLLDRAAVLARIDRAVRAENSTPDAPNRQALPPATNATCAPDAVADDV